MGRIINGVPDAVVVIGGAFAIYYLFIRDNDPYQVGSKFSAVTERQKFLAARKKGQKSFGQKGGTY